MFISKEIVFIELHKTGCTHINKLLDQILEGKRIGKHNPATLDLINSQRNFIGSIRNPWDWYVSLWAYGCDRKGQIFDRVTRPKWKLKTLGWRSYPLQAMYLWLRDFSRNPEAWRQCYADVNDPSAFRNWLYRMLDSHSRHDYGEGYGFSGISNFSGLLTYRYMQLFCVNANQRSFQTVSDFQSLKKFEAENCYINHFIKTENLESDLLRALNQCRVSLEEAHIQKILRSGKTNTSSRKKKAAYYYDRETLELVKEKENFIIEKFQYEAPILSEQSF